MPSVYDLKPAFQNLLRPVCNGLAKRNVTANQVTIAAAALSLSAGLIVLGTNKPSSALLILPFVLFVRMALNAIDGMLAREHQMKTDLGAILNEVGDVFSDAVLYLPLAQIAGFTPWLIVAIVIIAAIGELTGVMGVQISGRRHYEGPMGKSDRALFFGTIATLLGFGLPPGAWLQLLEVAIFGLSLKTVYNRATNILTDKAMR